MLKKQLLITSLFFSILPIYGQVIDISPETFDQKIIQHSGFVILDVYATWCGPCNNMKPIFEELSQEFKNQVTFAKIDIDKAAKIAASLEVEFLPTFFIFHNGSLIKKIVGSQSKEKLKAIIEQYLK